MQNICIFANFNSSREAKLDNRELKIKILAAIICVSIILLAFISQGMSFSGENAGTIIGVIAYVVLAILFSNASDRRYLRPRSLYGLFSRRRFRLRGIDLMEDLEDNLYESEMLEARLRATALRAKNYLRTDKNWNVLTFLNLNTKVIIDRSMQEIKVLDRSSDGLQCILDRFENSMVENIAIYLCKKFNQNTSYRNVVEYIKKQSVRIRAIESEISKPEKQKTDLNSLTQEELEKLPGISKALASRIYKRQRSNNPVMTMEEFFKEFKIKENFQTQLEDLVEIKQIAPKKQEIEQPHTKAEQENKAPADIFKEREVDF